MDGTRCAAEPRVASRSRRLARIVASAGLVFVFGCSGSTTTSPDAPPAGSALPAPASLRLAATVDTLRGLGPVALPAVQVLDADGRALSREIVWHLGSETPWIEGRPVVALAASATASLERVGFGTAHLHAALPDGSLRATFTLVVEGEGPTVVDVAAVEGADIAFDLIGWGLDGLGASDIQVDGRPADVLERVDSTRVRASTTTAVSAACTGTEWVEVRTSRSLHTLKRPRDGTLDLGPGEHIRLPRRDAHCLTFPSIPGARYYAGFVDVAAFEAYGDEALPWEAKDWDRVGGTAPLGIAVASRPSAVVPGQAIRAASVSPAGAPGFAAPDAWHLEPGTEVAASSSARELQVGDTMQVRARHCPVVTAACARSRPSVISARVEHVVDGWLAIAVPAGHDDARWREEVLTRRLESLAALGPDAGSGLLERLFDVARPGTTGSRQLVWVTGPEVIGAFASGATSGCSIQAPDGAPLATVVHELAHCFQFAADSGGRATRWALEGGADVAAWTLLRTRAGQGWSGEVPHTEVGGGAAAGSTYGLPFAVAPSGGTGTVARWADGYGASALLLDDWIARLALEGGIHPETAAREVLLGTLEQAYGAGAGGGLIPRMEAVWPGPFDIAGAMLESLARQVLDVQAGATAGAGIPWIQLDAGLVPPISDPAAALDASTGAAIEMALPHSSWGFVRFDDDDVGGSLEVVDGGRLDWVVVRVR